MPVFELGVGGQLFDIEAPDEQSAVQALSQMQQSDPTFFKPTQFEPAPPEQPQEPNMLQRILGLKASGNLTPEQSALADQAIEQAKQVEPSPIKKELESFGAGTDPFGAAAGGIAQSVAGFGLGAGELGREGLKAVVPEGEVRETLALDEPSANEDFSDLLKPQGKIQSAFKTGTDIVQFASASGGVNRILSSLDKLGKGGKALSLAKNVALRPVLEGLAGGTISAAQRGEIDDNVKSVAAMSAVFPLATKAITSVASLAKPIGKKIFSTAIGGTEKLKKEGFKVDTIFDEGVEGLSLGEMFNNTLKKTNEIKSKIKPLLQGQPAANLDDLTTAIEVRGKQLAKNNIAEASTIEKSTKTAIENIKKRFSAVDPNAAVLGTGKSKLNIIDLDDIRASYGEGATFRFGDSASESAKKKVAKMIWGESKDLLEKTVTHGDELNALRKRLSNLIPVRQALQDRMGKNSKNLAIGLLDTIFLGASLSGGSIFNPKYITAMALNRAQRSPAAANLLTKIARILDTTPKALDVLGTAVSSSIKKGITEQGQ